MNMVIKKLVFVLFCFINSMCIGQSMATKKEWFVFRFDNLLLEVQAPFTKKPNEDFKIACFKVQKGFGPIEDGHLFAGSPEHIILKDDSIGVIISLDIFFDANGKLHSEGINVLVGPPGLCFQNEIVFEFSNSEKLLLSSSNEQNEKGWAIFKFETPTVEQTFRNHSIKSVSFKNGVTHRRIQMTIFEEKDASYFIRLFTLIDNNEFVIIEE
jgi:hypothetical protein